MKLSPLYNFLACCLLHFVINNYIFDPCSVPLDQRTDCGYPGIDGATCQTLGKLSIVTRKPEVLLRMVVTTGLIFAITLWSFADSGFPRSLGLLYAAMALRTAFESTRCCHDSTVPSGPHCYY